MLQDKISYTLGICRSCHVAPCECSSASNRDMWGGGLYSTTSTLPTTSISTASAISASTITSDPSEDIYFEDDGLKCFVKGKAYVLSKAWDITTSSPLEEENQQAKVAFDPIFKDEEESW